MSVQPRVSVCIPTYNSRAFLGAAIDSVLAQTFADYELIVCDNASTDGTRDLCTGYRDPRLRYERHEQLVGQGGNWNRCVSHSRGEYVALLHADDVYHPGFLAARVRLLDDQPNVGLAFGAVTIIDEAGHPTGTQRLRPAAFTAEAPEFCRDLLMACVVNPVSPVVRKRVYDEVGRFDESLLWGIDWEMWLRVAASFAVAYCPEVHASYRVHGSSGSAHGLVGTRRVEDERAVLERFFARASEDPRLVSLTMLRADASRALALRALYSAGHNCAAGHRTAARQNLTLATTLDPRLSRRPTTWALRLADHLGSWVYRAFRRLRPLPFLP